MIIQLPRTLVKIGKTNVHLEDVMDGFSYSLFPHNENYNSRTYACFDDDTPFLLLVSQEKNLRPSIIGHNTAITVTSYSNWVNRNIIEQFERETKIDFNLKLPQNFVRPAQHAELFEKYRASPVLSRIVRIFQ
ncbi:MAG: hypothetical protein Q8N88_05750 [Nanoarchaeota archaeon]|nr:hypothetical protein [Nanoarchaeota archaeon]